MEDRDTPESIAKDFTDGHMSETHDKDTREGMAAGLARWIRAYGDDREKQGQDIERKYAKVQLDAMGSSQQAAQDDVAAVLLALDLGDHARPISCHEVVQREILPAIKRMTGR